MPRDDVDGIQIETELLRTIRWLGTGNEIHDVGRGIDDRRAQNAKASRPVDVAVRLHIFRDDGRAEIVRPQRRARIGIDRIYGIQHARDIDDIVGATSNRQVRHIQGLRIDVAIRLDGVKLSEVVRIYVRRGEQCFLQIGAGARIVIAACVNIHLRESSATGNKQQAEEHSACRQKQSAKQDR